MLRFKGATLPNEPASSLHLRQKTRLTAKRSQNGRPACSPESPDRLHETFANELRLERRSAELFLPAFFIGGAKGPGTSPLHGLKSKRQMVLVQAVRKRVMVFQSWQCSFQCQSRRGSATFQELGLMFLI
nr:uncharacterized protein LOC125990511 isoform X6 [Syngnathus scovelli]